MVQWNQSAEGRVLIKFDFQPAAVAWYWKKDLRFTDDSITSWEPYPEADSKRIEAAFQKKQKTFSMSPKYTIDFTDMVQHRKGVSV